MKKLLFISLLILVWSCSDKPKQENNEFQIAPNTQLPSDIAPLEETILLEQDEERTEWQNPDFVLKVLGDLKDKTVADVGAGSGYFTFKIARTAKKVIALDIDPNSLEYINNQKAIVGSWADNIEARLTPPDVPNLLDNETDLVLIVNTYGYIPNKDKYLLRLLQGLKKGGKLVIVDFKYGEIPVGPSDENKVSAAELQKSLMGAGFNNLVSDLKSLEFQYIITAEK
ncbi:MAG: SAM-dependent methyltransferase [Roseivirga sp.]|jgi:SAM-dependent methyltransferase